MVELFHDSLKPEVSEPVTMATAITGLDELDGGEPF